MKELFKDWKRDNELTGQLRRRGVGLEFTVMRSTAEKGVLHGLYCIMQRVEKPNGSTKLSRFTEPLPKDKFERQLNLLF